MTTWAPIAETRHPGAATPNLADHAAACASFSWKTARAELDGLPGGRGLNIAHEAVDRHAAGPRADHVAIRWLGKAGGVRDITYRALGDLTGRFANVLDRLGVTAGDRVYALMGRPRSSTSRRSVR